MHLENLSPWQHRHAYGAEGHPDGERRTRWVVGITLAMMVGEIVAGTAFGSMALLADGWHMGTHAAALGVAVFAYVYARRHAGDPRYSFGTGKVGALGGFASAVGLAVVALLVLGESALRLATPVAIRFDEAIAVAVLGLLVNLGSAVLLRGAGHEHGHEHGQGHEHEHGQGHEHGHGHGHGHEHEHGSDHDRDLHREHDHDLDLDHEHGHDLDHDHDHDHDLDHDRDRRHVGGGTASPRSVRPERSGAAGAAESKGEEHAPAPGAHARSHRDHNLRAAYLHVLADALTSLLAIVALVAGRAVGWTWMDPMMGIVGGAVIARWSYGLLRDTSAVLLDGEVEEGMRRAVVAAIEAGGEDRVADLHVWRVGPRHLAAILSVVTGTPRPPAHYRALLAGFPDLVHVTVEVNACVAGERPAA